MAVTAKSTKGALPLATPRRSLRSQMRITKAQPPPGKGIKQEPKDTKDGILQTSDRANPSPEQTSKPRKTVKKEPAEGSPFPNFSHPTPAECEHAHSILVGLHGSRARPENIVAPTDVAGCGNSPSVLDALVRTILSQNTSGKNSTRAKKSMDAVYGRCDNWDDIIKGGQGKLQETIRCGGLSVVKSKVIFTLLQQVHDKYGAYSLDHLFKASDSEAMREMLSFQGVGPKTASCVLLFCLQRPSFAVDTHVYRLTGYLGWRPEKATREQAQAHLDATVPDDLKYPLHVLFIKHGKDCERCRGRGGKAACKLAKAFHY